MKKPFVIPLVLLLSTILLSCARNKCCQNPSNVPQSNISDGTEIKNANLAIDVSNTQVKIEKDEITLTAKIMNLGPDDCSGETKIIVLLPRESQVISFSARDEDGNHLPISQCEGYLYCKIEGYGLCIRSGTIDKAAIYEVTINVTTRPSPKGVSPQFGVMAYGTRPESDVTNNYWPWK